MLITLLAWLYISFLCLVWGNLFLNATAKFFVTRLSLELPIVCMTGLSVIGVMALYLSFFMPLDWKAHCIILLPVLGHLLKRKNRIYFKEQINTYFSSFPRSIIYFLFASVCMVLLISSFIIKHPDTLYYHAEAIEWFKKYKAVPGIVHLKLELGFQSVWFASEAIFDPGIFGAGPYFFLGGAVLSWYFIFVLNKIKSLSGFNNSGIKKQNLIGWILLLIYTLASWTQVRLTAASASPDFIVTLYIFLAIYIFIQYKPEQPGNYQYLAILILFCCTVVSIKMSSIAILLLPIIILALFIQHKYFKSIGIILLLCAVLMSPVLIRNLIATGYPLYPSSLADIFHSDWKLDRNSLVHFQHYIMAYARFPENNIDPEKSVEVSFFSWIPLWWKHIFLADRLLLITVIASGISVLVFLKFYISKITQNNLIALVVAFAGSVLWFIKAPDPRFGTGFLICLLYIFFSPLREKFDFAIKKININISRGVMILLFFAITSYIIYRVAVFFKPTQIFYPAGIVKIKYQEFYCGNIKMYIREENGDFEYKFMPLPCVPNRCLTFIPRGKTIGEGFKNQ